MEHLLHLVRRLRQTERSMVLQASFLTQPILLLTSLILEILRTTISICPVQLDGTLGSPCKTSTGNGTFNQPYGIDLNNSDSILFVANGGAYNISTCPIKANGLLGTCTTFTADGTLNVIEGINLNPKNTFVYITNYLENIITICPLNTDGAFSLPMQSEYSRWHAKGATRYLCK